MPTGPVYMFGPYELNSHSRELTRSAERLSLGDRHLRVLVHLLTNAGSVVTKDAIIAAAWDDVAVTDNSLEQAVSVLRRMLGDRPEGGPYIETVARRGYRFAGDVTKRIARSSDDALEAILGQHRRWVEGRAALETLATDQITKAREVFEQVVKDAPDQAAAHVGLANACVMQYETTRADAEPDATALAAAAEHALDACRLDPQSGDAWAALGFVLARTGRTVDALAASRRATLLEPDNWRHHVRLASVAWGEERLSSARRTLALLPGCPLAHWLAATVLIARQALDEADRELAHGIASHDAQQTGTARFSGVALHWLRGLVLNARRDEAAALAELDRELSFEADGHMYARECCAHTWYAIGAIKLAQGDRAAAEHAFAEAVSRVGVHAMAHIGLAVAQGSDVRRIGTPPPLTGREAPVDLAIARAAAIALTGKGDQAPALVAGALAHAVPGSAGWLLPLEPLLRVWEAPDLWAPALAPLRTRAA